MARALDNRWDDRAVPYHHASKLGRFRDPDCAEVDVEYSNYTRLRMSESPGDVLFQELEIMETICPEWWR